MNKVRVVFVMGLFFIVAGLLVFFSTRGAVQPTIAARETPRAPENTSTKELVSATFLAPSATVSATATITVSRTPTLQAVEHTATQVPTSYSLPTGITPDLVAAAILKNSVIVRVCEGIAPSDGFFTESEYISDGLYFSTVVSGAAIVLLEKFGTGSAVPVNVGDYVEFSILLKGAIEAYVYEYKEEKYLFVYKQDIYRPDLPSS